MMIEEKLSKKITVLFTKTTYNRINDICMKTERQKSNFIRYIVQEWMNKIIK